MALYLEKLIHDVLSVDALENVALLDDMVQVCLHELEDQIEILFVGCPVHVQQSDDVGVRPKLFQEDYLSKCPLCVCPVSKSKRIRTPSCLVLRQK